MQQWLRAGFLTKHKASSRMSTQTERAALLPNKKHNVSPGHQFHGKSWAGHRTLKSFILSMMIVSVKSSSSQVRQNSLNPLGLRACSVLHGCTICFVLNKSLDNFLLMKMSLHNQNLLLMASKWNRTL